MVDKWSVLMDTVLNLIHDANVEGYEGECKAIFTSTVPTDAGSAAQVCLDIEILID